MMTITKTPTPENIPAIVIVSALLNLELVSSEIWKTRFVIKCLKNTKIGNEDIIKFATYYNAIKQKQKTHLK